MKQLVTIIFILSIAFVRAQSDNCATATVITLDASGAACVSGTTVGATSTNTGYSTCNPLPDVNNEVWYTFVTNGSVNVFDIIPQGMTNPEIVVYSSGCADFLETCNTSTGSGTLSTPIGLQPGSQIWIGVMSNQGTEGGFDFCITSTAPDPSGGNTCGGAIPLCDVNASTTVDMSTISPSGDQPPCFGSPMRNDVWFTFTCTVSGSLEFEAVPTGTGSSQVELDWALYDNTALGGCPTAVGASGSDPAMSCNYGYANGTGKPSGMSSNPPNGPAGGEYNAPVNIVAGNTYTIVMDYYSGGGTGDMQFDFLSGMTAEIAPAVDFSISPTTIQCAPSVDITITDNSIGVPSWDFGNGSTYTGNNPPVQTYPASGTYAITASITGACTSTHTEFVQVFGPLVSVPASTDETCIGDCDGDASVSISGGSGSYDYFWSPNGETSPSISGLCSGNYSVTVSDATCGTSVTESYTIGGTNCATCLLTNLTANISACAPATNTYTTNGIVEFTDAPTTGTLTVTDCNGVQQVFNAPFTSPINYNLTGQTANGAACSITATFSDDLTCTQTVSYTAPICLCNMDSFFASIGACDGVSNTFEINGDMAFTSPPSSGTLIVEVDNGTTIYDTIINAPFSSPQTWSISGIPANGAPITITTYFSADPGCTSTLNSTAPADCSCAADIGTFTTSMTGDGITNYVLCFGDQIDITSNGDYTVPADANQPGTAVYDPGMGYLIYSCPPTVGLAPSPTEDVVDDPCLIGFATGGEILTSLNTTGNVPWGGTYSNNTVYYVPITMYSLTDMYYSVTNTNIPCYDLGAPIAVQYLPEVISNPTEDCFAGTVTVVMSGGLPAVDGSLFTGTNLVPVTASFTNGTASNGGSIIVSGLQNGDNYSFDIIDDNGCPVTISGTFTGAPIADAGTDNTSCTLSYALSPNPTFGTGTWTGPAGVTFSPSATTANATVTVPSSGAYTFTWTENNGGGCMSTDDVVIIFSNLTQTFIENCPSTVTSTVQGGYTGVSGVNTASNLLPATAFFVNNTAGNGGTITIDGLQNGDMYSFDITDDNGCVVSVSGGPFVGTPVAIAGSDVTSCALTTNLAATASFGTGTWSGPVGVSFSNINSATSSVTVPAEGSYTFTWTEDNGAGCASSDDVIITFSNLSQTFVEDCQAASVTATIQGAYTGVSGIVTATSLLPATASFVNATTTNGGTIVVDGLQNGDMYSFDVTDDNGCVVTVTGGPFIGVPVADAGTDDGVCTLAYTLAANPSYGTGTWTGPAGATFSNANSPTSTVTMAASGTYTFTWTEDNGGGCISTDDVIIQFSDLTYTENIVQSTCGNSNGEITLTASNGIGSYSYSIDGGATFPNTTGQFTGLAAGPYNVAVQDGLGCLVTGVVNVTDQGGPTINSITPIGETCNGSCDGSISINATGASQFSIDGGATFQATNAFSNLCAGDYNVMVENALGCQLTDVTTVTEPTAVTLSTTPTDLLCAGVCTGEIAITSGGGTGTLQYSIDNGATFSLSNNFTGLCAGSFDVLVEDANGCQIAGIETVGEPTAVSWVVGQTNPTCNGYCDGQINTIPSGGSGTYSYAWLPASTGGNVPLVTNLCEGTYSLTVTDGNGCSIDTTISIVAPQAVTIDNIAVTDEICGGDCTGSLTVTSTGGSMYSIDGTNFSANNTFTNLCSGNYTVYVQDASQCEAEQPTVIAGPTTVQVTALQDTMICIGGTATLSSQGSGGVGNYTYQWDNGDLTQTINVSPSGAQIYCVTAMDGNGCPSLPACVTVSMYQALQLTAFSSQSICEGSSADISAIANGGLSPYTYTWNQGIGVGQNQTVSPSNTTDYTVTVTDQCETPFVTATVTITVNINPIFQFSADNINGCSPVIASFSADNVPVGSSYYWIFGDGSASQSANPTNVFTEPGCWSVTLNVTSPEGCSGQSILTDYICVYDYPTADFSFAPTNANVLKPTVNFENNSYGGSTYNWTFDTYGSNDESNAENPTYTFPNDEPGTYEVCLTTTTEFGCVADTCKEVTIYDEFIVYVPNAFSPEGDGYNEVFYPVVKGIDPLRYEFLVFNRWGQLIFESAHPSIGWDGFYRNVLSQTDVYVWKLSVVEAASNQKHEYIGHVTLLK